MRMRRMNGKLLCGKTDGSSYVSAVLPRRENREWVCPDNYNPCIPDSEYSFCYPNGQESTCPITDIKFVKNAEEGEIERL